MALYLSYDLQGKGANRNMANLCEFEMRIRGSEEAITKVCDNVIVEDMGFGESHGDKEDQICYVFGSCPNSVYSSILNAKIGKTSILRASKRLKYEIEVVGITENDVSKGSVERYHIKDGCVIRSGEYGMKKNYRKHTVTVDWELDYSLVEKPEET